MSSNWPDLSDKITSRNLVINDLDVHILEASPPADHRKPHSLLVLLHGFPELAYSWRKVIVPLSEAGYHVVAPDQRGYGRTVALGAPGPVRFEDDLAPWRMINLAKDVVALVFALGYDSAAAVVGHDYGSTVAGYCALIRPDIFKSVVLMSAPFTGPPAFVSDTVTNTTVVQPFSQPLNSLHPARKHYTIYYSTPTANLDMSNPSQGLHTFLRTYYHVKSADWTGNQPHRLPSSSASALAVMPNYYIMPLGETMPECIAHDAPSPEEIKNNSWLTEDALTVYVAEYSRTGFQGGLNRYRCMTESKWTSDLMVFSGKKIEVPAMFIAGRQDWGVYQYPGAAERMKDEICERMHDDDFVLIDGAGHWVQQEKEQAVVEHLLHFMGKMEIVA